MYQIDVASAATALPASTAAGTPGFFTDGNPATGVPATIVPAEYMNALMLEILNVIAAANIAPAKGNHAQLLAAINAIVTASLAPAATTDVAGVVELATAQELADGTAGDLAVTSGILKPVLDGKQAAAANLSALAGLAGVANSIPYFTGAGALSLATLTAAARTLLAATDAAGQRTAMGLGTASMATVMESLSDTTSGRLMPYGAFGLGASIPVTSGNVLDYRPNGIYHIDSTNVTGSPTGGNGVLVTNSAPGDPNFATYTFYSWNGIQYRNTRNIEGWGGWKTVFDGGNVSPFIQTLFGAADAPSAQTMLKGFGYNQTWQDVRASRALGTTYTNTAGRPIHVFIDVADNGATTPITLNIGGISWSGPDPIAGSANLPSFVIPPGATYSISGGITLRKWLELR